jgi:hypothetical protein
MLSNQSGVGVTLEAIFRRINETSCNEARKREINSREESKKGRPADWQGLAQGRIVARANTLYDRPRLIDNKKTNENLKQYRGFWRS